MLSEKAIYILVVNQEIIVTHHGVSCQCPHSCGYRNLLSNARQKETPAYAGVTASCDRLEIICLREEIAKPKLEIQYAAYHEKLLENVLLPQCASSARQ